MNDTKNKEENTQDYEMCNKIHIIRVENNIMIGKIIDPEYKLKAEKYMMIHCTFKHMKRLSLRLKDIIDSQDKSVE